MFIIEYPSEVGAVQGAVDNVLWRDDVEKLKDRELFADMIWEDEKILFEAEKGEDFGDQKNGTGAGRAGTGNEEVGRLWRSERAE